MAKLISTSEVVALIEDGMTVLECVFSFQK